MMADNGKALSKTAAATYAEDNGLCFLDGSAVKIFWEGIGHREATPGMVNMPEGVCQDGR
jgi:hypothetical protein